MNASQLGRYIAARPSASRHDKFVVRAEAPGIDPAKELSVSVADGRVQISIERAEPKPAPTHTEFHYGPVTRVIQLPVNAQEEGITADYDNGLVEIRIPAGSGDKAGRDIPVKRSTRRKA